jgi:hypothetical protein
MGVVKEHTHAIDGIAYTTQTMAASDGLKILPRMGTPSRAYFSPRPKRIETSS